VRLVRVYGYKQSWGRVPGIFRPNAFAGTSPFLFEGVLTRTVADAALGMSALAGPDPRDPYSLPDDVDFLAALDRDVAGLRIAYSPDLDVFPVDRRIAAVVAEAVRAFEEAGAYVEEVRHRRRRRRDRGQRRLRAATALGLPSAVTRAPGASAGSGRGRRPRRRCPARPW
jgi:amidase/aspartyl-tRNA(Asn)/glutamyl-tRNA(Gln) amidotransferase subunit A